ncbi:MAG: putative membrane protein, partial [Gammaproteobacteria bacterium]
MSRIFLNGLAIVLPAVLTLALLWWFGSSLETALGSVLRLVLPAGFYFPG